MDGFLDRLYQDQSTKDVSIEMSDGLVSAHSVVLCAASDAIRGLLQHGLASENRTLHWKDQPVEVGHFFLRLLYTGTVAEEGELKVEVPVPLRLLLGSLALAKIFMVPHLLKPLTTVLTQRISSSTFDEICVTAINTDLTELRLACAGYARSHGSTVDFPLGTRFRAIVHIRDEDNGDGATVPEETIGEIGVDSDEDCDGHELRWSCDQVMTMVTTRRMLEIGKIKVLSGESSSLFARYQKGQLSPQVLSELAPLWGLPADAGRKRRKLIR